MSGEPFCLDGVRLDAVTARLHRAHVQNRGVCSGDRIAEPAGDWVCEVVPVCDDAKPAVVAPGRPASWSCVQPTDVCRQGFRGCHRRYRCRAQSDDYNFEKLARDRREATDKSWEQRTRGDAPPVDTCAALPAHLAACTPFRCERTHPVLADVVLHLEVLGRGAGGCRFQETVAGGMLRTCTLVDSPPASPDPDADPVSRALVGAECEVDLAPETELLRPGPR